jgi:hypothetical protein
MFILSRLPNQLDAWTMRCKTLAFQRIVRDLFDCLLPNDKEKQEDQDLRNIMLRWGCDRRDILRSDALPHPVNLGETEIPVCALPFVLNIRPFPALNAPTRFLSIKAAELMTQLARVLDGLRENRLEARFSDISDEKLQIFVDACKAFVFEYVRYTHQVTQIPDIFLYHMLPEIYEQEQRGGQEGKELMANAKALYFGLHGVSLTETELHALCGIVADQPLMIRAE